MSSHQGVTTCLTICQDSGNVDDTFWLISRPSLRSSLSHLLHVPSFHLSTVGRRSLSVSASVTLLRLLFFLNSFKNLTIDRRLDTNVLINKSDHQRIQNLIIVFIFFFQLNVLSLILVNSDLKAMTTLKVILTLPSSPSKYLHRRLFNVSTPLPALSLVVIQLYFFFLAIRHYSVYFMLLGNLL